ncbi:DNA replication and repair protein RecF [Frankliniella fusca]|uniref:DNA replication and repair protein RecF n=1 Tax=Frankliniella fusca TaxID=407009 RepID=A0AAE1H8Q5_9NEOP|nr:DNA replication and repair protein RecF [Frankliniella fusca]
MGVPLRQCASTEPPDQPGASCLSEEMMSFLQNQIDDMWRKLQNIFEVFQEESAQHLGYRLRVKEGLPIKVTMSDLKENQYLGGPLSYSNWAASKDANLTARQVTHGSRKYLVRGECKFVAAGCELLWDYGKKVIPQFNNHDWFKEECCFVVETIPKSMKSKESLEICRELCVLCGKPYKCNRRDWTKRRPQKKVHFINSHINFLGTDWDGCGDFDPSMYEVDYDRALIEAERLNRFLQRLHSDSWKAVPACAVMKKQELDTLSSDAVMKIFRNRCEMLNELGSIVVRGRTVPSLVEHLHPVRPSSWFEVFPKNEQPKKRKYALSKEQMKAMHSEFDECALQDIFLAIPRCEDSDSSSESESESS